jgi:hypothetical protein
MTGGGLLLGEEVPNFKAESSCGPLDWHEFIGAREAVSIGALRAQLASRALMVQR